MTALGKGEQFCSAIKDGAVALGALVVPSLPEMARSSAGNEFVGGFRGVFGWAAYRFYHQAKIKSRDNKEFIKVAAGQSQEIESDTEHEIKDNQTRSVAASVADENRPLAQSIAVSKTDMHYGTHQPQPTSSTGNCAKIGAGLKYLISAAAAGACGVGGEYLHQVFTFFNAISGTPTPSTTLLSTGLGMLGGEAAYQTMERLCCRL